MHEATLVLNGRAVALDCEHRTPLADFLRDSGTHSVHLG